MQLICWYHQLTAMCIVQNECFKPNLFIVRSFPIHIMEPIMKVKATATTKCLNNNQEYPRLSYNIVTALGGGGLYSTLCVLRSAYVINSHTSQIIFALQI